MNQDAEPLSRRPDLRATVLQFDLTDKSYQALAKFSDRLASLLSNATVQADPNAVGSLDDLLGAVYSLILARHHHFVDRTDRPIEIDVVRKRAEQVKRGDVRIDGKWIAGWHFNSALFRAAAVYHRLLKVAVEKPETQEYVPKLRPKVEALYRQWKKADWSSERIHAVHTQVNTLKHSPPGVHDVRTATFEDAVAGIDELLNLVEAWSIRT